MNLYLKNGFKDEKIAKILPGISEGYRGKIQQLVKSKKIDNNYRMYFYNYPQNSRILNVDERTVQRATLYGEEIEGLEESIGKVIENHSKIRHGMERKPDWLSGFPVQIYCNRG